MLPAVTRVLIESDWNLKLKRANFIWMFFVVLIESDWNLKMYQQSRYRVLH